MSKPIPQVSIGMPVYNGEPFIHEALDSLLAQTFTDFELIISDNASTDGTEAICREYAARDPRIRYVRQGENRGAAANFQFVLDEAVGEYFMWAAADDKIDPVFINSLCQILDGDKEIILAMSDVSNISSNGSYIGTTKLENIRLEKVKKDWIYVRSLFFENPTSNIFFCIYGLFRIKELREIELNYRNKIKFASASEVPFLAQLSLLGKIASIPFDLKIYRRHHNSVFHAEQKKMNFFSHIENKFNVSYSLIFIVARSHLRYREKIYIFQHIVLSFTKWFFRYIIGSFLRLILKQHFLAKKIS